MEASMELRMQVEDRFLNELQNILKAPRATDVVREALTLLNWAAQERAKGRVILSADADGHNVARLAMPSLDRIYEDRREDRRAAAAAS
jgi:hypothetical protein